MAVPVRNSRRRAAQCAGADAWAHRQDARGAVRPLGPGLRGETLERVPALHRVVTSASKAAQPDAVEDRHRRSVMTRQPLIFERGHDSGDCGVLHPHCPRQEANLQLEPGAAEAIVHAEQPSAAPLFDACGGDYRPPPGSSSREMNERTYRSVHENVRCAQARARTIPRAGTGPYHQPPGRTRSDREGCHPRVHECRRHPRCRCRRPRSRCHRPSC